MWSIVIKDIQIRNKDSLWSVFMGKESAKRLLTYVEDLLSLSPPEQFARTFRDGNKVFILQLGFNVQELSNDL